MPLHEGPTTQPPETCSGLWAFSYRCSYSSQTDVVTCLSKALVASERFCSTLKQILVFEVVHFCLDTPERSTTLVRLIPVPFPMQRRQRELIIIYSAWTHSNLSCFCQPSVSAIHSTLSLARDSPPASCRKRLQPFGSSLELRLMSGCSLAGPFP